MKILVNFFEKMKNKKIIKKLDFFILHFFKKYH